MELLIVIVVIGILAAISIVAYSGIQERAKFVSMQSDMQSLNKAIQMYYADNGSYPQTSTCGVSAGDWCGWNRAVGESFIPGISPKYIAKTPQLTSGSSRGVAYLYRSPDGVDYKLIRYLDGAELSSLEKSQPTLLDGSSTNRWGYWSGPNSRYW